MSDTTERTGVALVARKRGAALVSEDHDDFVTMMVDSQLFGIAVLTVQDVLGPQTITRVPLAPREVAGSLNLRGRIVTAVDVRLRLGLNARAADDNGMSVVVDHRGELYSLIIDQVGEVLSLPRSTWEPAPATLHSVWRDFAEGIHRLDDKLMVVLDVGRLLQFEHASAV